MHLVARWTPIKWEGVYGMSLNLFFKNACLFCLYLPPMNGLLFVSAGTTISKVFSRKSPELLRKLGMKWLSSSEWITELLCRTKL